MKLKLALAAAMLFVVGLSLHAQVTTAGINGLVLDNNDQPLIGATVTATHEPSGTFYGTTTREDGRFNLPNLRVGGPYKVSISYTGFETREEIIALLKLGERRPLYISLSTGTVDLEGVTVTAGGLISSDRTGAETNVTAEQLNALPTISRSASDFTRLTPASDGNSFGGRNDQFNNFSLDGSIFNNPFGLDAATPGGQSGAQPISLDAIDQINVSLAPYDVTQAGFTGAAVNAVTKSGTNELKGTVFGFFRNQDLTGARVNGDEVVVADLSQTQFGASLGGPLVKDKLFFFANFEVDNRTDLGTTFIANRTNLSGENVSRVEANDLELVSSLLNERYGYETGSYEGYLHDTESTKGIFKFDWAINESHTLTATYNFLNAFKDKPAHPSAIGRRGPDLTTLQFQNSGYRINNDIQSGILELRSIFGNKASNKLQVGYTAFRDARDPFSEPFPSINVNKDGIRYIIAGHEPFSIHNRLNQNVFQFTNNFNIYAGNHTFTVGASLDRFDFDNSFNLGAYAGVFGIVPVTGTPFSRDFNSIQEFSDSLNAGFLDALVEGSRKTFSDNGGDEGFDLESGWALAESAVGQLAVYLQDEWAASSKFTLTYGLRVDMPLYFNTVEKIEENIQPDRNCCYDPSIVYYDAEGNPVTYDQTVLPSQAPLFSPRVGFNYDVFGNQKTQLRGGSGLFTGRLPFVWLGSQVASPNWFFYNITDPNFKFPQVWRSNLGYDQVFGDGWTTTIDLIYTKDLQAPFVANHSLRPPSGTLNDPADNRPVYTLDDHALDPFGGPLFGSGYVYLNTNIGYSFNASVQIQKRFENGLNLMLGYNFLDAKDASSIDAEISSDAFDRNPALGNVNVPTAATSIYGNRHRFLGSAYHTFTYGAQKQFGTTISTFFSFANAGTTLSDFTSDFRHSYTYSGDINGDGSVLNDLIYIPTDAELDQQSWASDAEREAFRAFIEQDEYLSENRGSYSERYAGIAPWYSSWDFRILQDFNFAVGTRINTIQLSLDVVNFGNLLSSSWNVKQLPINTQPVGVTVDENGVPTYSFDTSLQSTYSPDFSLDSRWQARVGLRYIF
ncbi:MAG: carboxypeptidase regulatory-like domain-containing protein [Bacteroidota bacterium]